MPEPTFTGDRKVPLRSPFATWERKFVEANVDGFPRWIETYHLTLMTILWSAGVVLAGWLAGGGNRQWLWLSSLLIALQWFTDCFDGALGRRRQTGLRRWGFYMDHFLDYLFMACVTGHYAFLVPEPARTWFLLLIPLYAGFEVNSWLDYGATGQFKITYNGLGPTEARLCFILVNTAVIFFGSGFLTVSIPWFMAALGIILAVTAFRTQRRIWAMDMAEKAAAGTDK